MLDVSNLHVLLQTQRGPAEAIRGISFELQRGDTLGLVGESGCGKSMTAMALMGLLPESATVTGSIRLDGQQLIGQPDTVLRHLRGNRIGMIFQEPMTALNPVHTVGDQVAEPLLLHRGLTRAAARTRSTHSGISFKTFGGHSPSHRHHRSHPLINSSEPSQRRNHFLAFGSNFKNSSRPSAVNK